MTSTFHSRWFCGKKGGVDWTYISPHLDDVAFSCGGLIWEQTNAGELVSIWTIFAGDPPEGPLSNYAEKLQTRWQWGRKSISKRREEDIFACARIGASYRHFALTDCIYRGAHLPSNESEEQEKSAPGERGFYYTSHQSLFGPIHPAEIELIKPLSQILAKMLPKETQLVCPLALGDHVDHKITRAAVEYLKRRAWYYADYPYVTESLERIEAMEKSGWKNRLFPVSEAGMEAWKEAVASHKSQISTFWLDLEAMRVALEEYREFFGGVMLWQPMRFSRLKAANSCGKLYLLR
jgi:LmbE family N-acetylglucosaminyl deacetylase